MYSDRANNFFWAHELFNNQIKGIKKILLFQSVLFKIEYNARTS